MASTYGQLQILVGADTSPLRTQVNTAANQIGAQAGASMGQRISSALGGAARAIGTTLATGFTVAAGAAAVFGTSVVKAGISYNTLAQTSNAAFKTILGSADAASKMMGDLAAFAKTSPFPRQAFIEASQQMLAFGIQSQKVIPYLGAVQDAVAAAGGGAQQLREVTFIMSQISAAGKITATDLMQFGQRGINAAELIGSQMGKTGAQIREDITNGALDANVALDSLAAGMAATYGGAAANVKNTWAGAKDRVLGAMRDIGSAIVEPFISKAGGGIALDWANSLATLLRALEPAVTPLVNAFAARLAPAMQAVTGTLGTLADKAKVFVSGMNADALVSQFGKLAPALAPLSGALLAIGGTSLKGLLGPLGALIPGLSPIAGIIAGIAVSTPEMRAALMGLVSAFGQIMVAVSPIIAIIGGALQPVFAVLGQTILSIIPSLVPVILDLASTFGQLVMAVAPLLAVFAGVAGAGIAAVVNALLPLAPIIIKVVAAIKLFSIAMTILNFILDANPIVLIIIAIVALVGAFIYLWNNVEGFRNFFIAIWSGIQAVISAVVGWFTNTVGPAFAAAWDGIITGVSNVWNTISTILVNIGNFIAGALEFIKTVVQTAFLIILGIAILTWQGIWSAIQGPVMAVANFIQGVWGAVSAWVSSMWANFLAGIQVIWSVIVGVIGAAVNAVKGVITGVWGALTGIVSSLLSPIIGLVSAVWNAVYNAIAGPVQRVWSIVVDAFNRVVSAVQGAVGSVGSAARSVGQSIIDGVSGFVGQMAGIGRSIVDGLIGGIKAGIGAVADAARGVATAAINAAKSALGIGSPSKVFMLEVGLPTMEGWALGVDKGAPMVASALDSAAAYVPAPPAPADVGLTSAGVGTTGTATDVVGLLQQVVRLLQDGTSVEIDSRPVAAAVSSATFYGVRS